MTEAVLNSINEVIEMIAILTSMNLLFTKKYHFKVHDAIFLVFIVLLYESVNYFDLSSVVVLVGYICLYIYELTKFKCSIRKANINIILCMIWGTLAQLVCSFPFYFLEKYISMDIIVILINALFLAVTILVGMRGWFYNISQKIETFDSLGKIAAIICFVGLIYVLVAYKLDGYMRVTDYIIFGVWTILIVVLIIKWQQERYDKITSERELKLRETYDEVYMQLVESIRQKQHDFHNHIMTIYSQHALTDDYDTLVAMQREYCDEVLQDNRFVKLLSNNAPMLSAFLYSKFTEAESKGCKISYDIRVDKLECYIPQYRFVEMMGVLLDNAIEALVDREDKEIKVVLLEDVDSIQIHVENSSAYYTQEQLSQFIKPGYSTKGDDRGVGLTKVLDMVHTYDAELNVCCNREPDSRISFDIKIAK